MWREGLVQGEGLEPFHRFGDAEDAVVSGNAAPTYNNPSGPWTWLAFDGKSGKQTRAEAANGGGPDGPGAAAPPVAYNWRKDLKADGVKTDGVKADGPPPGANLKQDAAAANHVALKEEPEQPAKEPPAPPKRKKPRFM
eukprot:5222795-Prymnesium_polylepis.1